MPRTLKRKQTTLASLKKQVQTVCNRYIRERDCFGTTGGACIACGEWFDFSDLDAGHYRPSTHSFTRFMEDNIHIECHKCNRFLHGNLTAYFRGLERKLGRARLDEIDALPRTKKWTREELKELRENYKQKLASLRAGIPPEVPGSQSTVSELFSGVRNDDNLLSLSYLLHTIRTDKSEDT